MMPALYYHQDENGELDAMLCTHVDDLLFAHKPSGAKVIQEILGKFSVGKERLKTEASGTVDVGLPSTMISRSKSMLRRTPEESSQF